MGEVTEWSPLLKVEVCARPKPLVGRIVDTRVLRADVYR